MEKVRFLKRTKVAFTNEQGRTVEEWVFFADQTHDFDPEVAARLIKAGCCVPAFEHGVLITQD